MRSRLGAAPAAALVVALVAMLGVSGCATVSATFADVQTGAAPHTLSNCGSDVSVTDPQAVVTIKSSTTELMLALGLADRIVGMAYLDGPIPQPWDADAAHIPVLAERVPSMEAVLELEPDLIYAGWESNLTADGAGDRDTLATLGVASYVSPAACGSLTAAHPRVQVDDIFQEITEIAAIFGAEPDALIAEQEAVLAGVEPLGQPRSALWFSSGSSIPFVGGGTGAPQLVMDRLGLVNIAAELGEGWAPFSWEAVVDADPEVIVLVDSAWNSAAQKIAVLEGNPATARLDAVRHGRYLIAPFAATEAGVRTIPLMADLRGQLDELGLG